MSRIVRIVLEHVAYHITQRGNGRQQVFFEDRDYLLYQDLLRNSCAATGLRLWAYCLMPNHVHLLAVPDRAEAIAKGMGRTHAAYACHYNLRNRRCGRVWQARSYSAPLDEGHLWRAMAYVERNPGPRAAGRAGGGVGLVERGVAENRRRWGPCGFIRVAGEIRLAEVGGGAANQY